MYRADVLGPEAGPRDRGQVVQQRSEERERGAEKLFDFPAGAEQNNIYPDSGDRQQ